MCPTDFPTVSPTRSPIPSRPVSQVASHVPVPFPSRGKQTETFSHTILREDPHFFPPAAGKTFPSRTARCLRYALKITPRLYRTSYLCSLVPGIPFLCLHSICLFILAFFAFFWVFTDAEQFQHCQYSHSQHVQFKRLKYCCQLAVLAVTVIQIPTSTAALALSTVTDPEVLEV